MPHLAARVFNTPLMIDGQKATAILNGIGNRFFDGGVCVNGSDSINHIAFSKGRIGKIGDNLGRRYDRAAQLPFDVINNVAVIPIEGTLVHKGDYIGANSGNTSYQGLQTQIQRAISSPQIKAVVFEVDSFGGEVSGAFETAALISELSVKKPTLAILTDFAYSAGYLLASAARKIVMPEFGGAGSIGVITVHVDYSQQMENEGVKVNIIKAGEFKADGNSYEALPDRVRNEMQQSINEMRDKFATVVGNNRGSKFTKEAALKSEAATYRGAEAYAAGLVDGVGNPNTMFNEFLKAINS